MNDMTLAEALALADQDAPLPHLAGKALKVLRDELNALRRRHAGPVTYAPMCSLLSCNNIGWMPCANHNCPKMASAKDC